MSLEYEWLINHDHHLYDREFLIQKIKFINLVKKIR